MGEVISLLERRNDLSRRTRSARPAFFFDLACPFSYLAAERIERVISEADWIPAAAPPFRRLASQRDLESMVAAAEARAAMLRLPLVWPERFPAYCPRTLRAAGYAAEIGVGAQFALAAARLAFCGGFDLEDPEILAEAAAAAGMHLDHCLAAASDVTRDAALRATTEGMITQGVRQLPAIKIGRLWFDGEAKLGEAAALLRARVSVPARGDRG